MIEIRRYRTQHLRGTSDEWREAGDNITPLAGEIVIEIDDNDDNDLKLHRLKIGDGSHTYNELPYISVDSFVLPTRIKLTLGEKWETKYDEDETSVLYYYQDITANNYGQLDDNQCIDDSHIKMLTVNSRVDLYNINAA
jgi:hypothetical protein